MEFTADREENLPVREIEPGKWYLAPSDSDLGDAKDIPSLTDLKIITPGRTGPSTSLLFGSCYSAPFSRTQLTAAAGSKTQESYSYPKTTTIRGRFRGGIFLGGMMQTAMKSGPFICIEEFLAAVETSALVWNIDHRSGRYNAKSLYWHHVAVEDQFEAAAMILPRGQPQSDDVPSVHQLPDLIGHPIGIVATGAGTCDSQNTESASPDTPMTPSQDETSPDQAYDNESINVATSVQDKGRAVRMTPEASRDIEDDEDDSTEDESDEEDFSQYRSEDLKALTDWFYSVHWSVNDECTNPGTSIIRHAHDFRRFINENGRYPDPDRDLSELFVKLRCMKQRASIAQRVVDHLRGPCEPFETWVSSAPSPALTENQKDVFTSVALVMPPCAFRLMRKVVHFVVKNIAEIEQNVDNAEFDAWLARSI